jgi:hypothetical protein
VLRGHHAAHLKTLGWLFFVGPAVAAIAELSSSGLGSAALFIASPNMLAAILCAVTAAVVGGAPPEPLPGPIGVRAPPIAARVARPEAVKSR